MKFKPILKETFIDYGACYECPVCKNYIDGRHAYIPDFCSNCGVAFEWVTDEDKKADFAKQILDCLDRKGTERTILLLKEIAEVD